MLNRLYSRVVPSILLSLSFLTASPVSAHDADSDHSVRLSDVVVTATKTERDLQEVPVSMSVVTSEMITRQGLTTVADALRDVPGVELYDQSVPGAKRVLIRGESASRVLILIDGQKISEQKSMDGAAILVNPGLIERIEVIKGPASVLYGSEAIGGVVNIITKKGGERPLEAEITTTFDSSTNGFDNYISAFGSYEGFSYRLSGTYADHGDRRAADDRRLASTGHRNHNLSGYLDYAVGNFRVGYLYDNYDSRVESFTPDGVVGDTMQLFQLDLPEWSREKHAGFVELTSPFKPLLKARLDVHHQNTYKDFRQDMEIVPSPVVGISRSMRTVNDQDSTGVSLQTDWLLLDSHHIIVGFDYNSDDLKADSLTVQSTAVSMPPPGSVTTEVYDYYYKARQDTYAAYIQDEWALPRDFTLTLGARQTWVESKLRRTDDPGLADVKNRSTDNNLVFSSGLVWQGIDNLALRALYSQGYRYPNSQQLFIGTTHGSDIPTIPNPDLKPETSDTFEVGVRYNDSAWSLDFAIFHTRAEDYISTRLNPAGTERTYVNINKANTHGAELYAGHTFQELHLTPYVSGSYLRRQFKTSEYSTWDTGHPELFGRAGLRFERGFEQPGIHYHADLFARFADKAKERDSAGGTTTYSSWETLNFSTGMSFGSELKYSVFLNFNNIFDRKYTIATASVPEAGRHVVLGASFRF